MRTELGNLARIGLYVGLLLGFSVGLSGCVGRESGSRSGGGQVASTTQALQTLQSAFPTARMDTTSTGRVLRIYGAPMSTGATPAEAAERFRQDHAAALGVAAGDLTPQDSQGRAVASTGAGAAPTGIGLMYDKNTGQHKYWLYRYGQSKAGLRVHRSGLLTLVRNGGGNPVVWASSSLRDLSTFAPNAGARARAVDATRSLGAIRMSTDFAGRPQAAPTALSRVSQPELVVYAGTDESDAPPRLAIDYVAESDSPLGKWRFVADAVTGEVIHMENLIVFENVTGTVSGNVTQGAKSMECAAEAPTGFGYAEVNAVGGSSTIADVNGAFVLPNGGTSAVDVVSLMGGQYFDVINFPGNTAQLLQSVVPPGPTSFLHNASNTDPLLLAQVNGYANANQVRKFLLQYLPSYPIISTQVNFPVYVNRTDILCPGNAWYDFVSINFCVGSATYGNTSFASVSHHEFGHHIVTSGGSGQGEYGEGMGDVVAALLAGDPGLGYGFFLNQCTNPLRNASNTCQYSATSCSSCGSEAHDCGNLISGTIWSIRNQLAITNPTTYVDLINSLALSSIPMHTGTGINSSIAITLLTLDDNDGILDNGSPHYNEICAGFTAHGMTCPPLLTGLGVGPSTTLNSEGPVGGPFAPASVVYTVTNLGPTPSLQYQVSPVAATPWISITNGTGTLAVGQQAQVTVSINQAAAAVLAKGGYNATVQFVNVTNGTGSTTRGAHLEVGVPQAIFLETFEGGLGGFTLGSEPVNLWHITGGCASTQAGHSTPQSLYFGIDSSCTFNNGLTSAGTATSPPIAVSDTSVVKLRLNYFLAGEGGSTYDKATVQVSVNGGAYTVVASNSSGGQALLVNSGVWQPIEVDLSSLLVGLPSASVSVRFGFNTVDSIANSFTGFMVDDVELRAFAGAPCTTNAQCDDGAFCNGSETCSAGTCTAGTAVNCNDGVSCTQDSCNESTDACVHAPSNALCDDGQICNGAETCNATTGCQAGTPVNCNDSNACTADSCTATGCQNVAISCDDGNVCTNDSCNTASGCQHANNTNPCADDGNVCTNDVCAAGACGHPNNTAPCADDGNVCTNDICSAGVCTHPNSGSCGSGAFIESAGQVVIEAEHFSVNVPRASHTWDLTADGAASGGQTMLSNPNNGANINTGYTTGSPQLDFPINFSTTGTYHVWIRGLGAGTADRTLHAGIDGTGPASADRISAFTATLSWHKNTLDTTVATINVTTAGRHTLNVWMREDGFRIDKILLTTNSGLTPSGAGPAESARSASCTTAANCNDSNACTTDTCVAGSCLNAPAAAGTACTDDGNVCTNDVCSAGACTHPNNTAACASDGNSCTNDVCSGGVCTHPNNGSCGSSPCASFCANPVTFNVANFQSGNLGTAATCHQTTLNLQGGVCGNFVSPRTLFVNGTQMSCTGNWPALPPKVNGGYCVYTNAGNHPWAYFATW